MGANQDDDVPSLHGMRGCLALWVLFGHTMDGCGANVWFARYPGVAVQLFMVVSGFLMAFHFIRREQVEPWGAPRTWLLFYVRRFFRIAPVYYLALAVSFTFHDWMLGHYWRTNYTFGPPPFTIEGLLAHLSFVFGVIPLEANNNILPDWSIGLEMQFYLVLPFLMLTLRALGPLFFAVGSLVITEYARGVFTTFPQPSFLPLSLVFFVIGILMAQGCLERDRLKAGICFAAAVFLARYRRADVFYYGAFIMMALISFGPIADMLRLKPVVGSGNRVLGGRLGRYLGDRSYSLYLTHMLVMVPLLHVLRRLGFYDAFEPTTRYILASAMMLAICLPLSGLILHTVERLGIRYGRDLVRRLQSSKPVPSTEEATVR